MKRRCAFSVAAVATLAALSIVAFTSRLTGALADGATGRRMLPETAAAIGQGTTAGLRLAATGTAPAEKIMEEPYQPLISGMDCDAEEPYLLAKIAMAEAEGEDTEGKALVMLVVLNRVLDDEFPDTVGEVIYQPGQFSPVSNGRFDEVEPDADCWAALDLIMLDKWDGSRGATYFESKSESIWHSENLVFLFRHGGHYFYTD